MVLAGHIIYDLSGWYYLLDHVDPHMHGAGWAHGMYVYVMTGRYHLLDHVDPCRWGTSHMVYVLSGRSHPSTHLDLCTHRTGWANMYSMLCLAGTAFPTILIHVCMVMAGHMVYIMSGQYHLLVQPGGGTG